jgi:hypothetical protein
MPEDSVTDTVTEDPPDEPEVPASLPGEFVCPRCLRVFGSLGKRHDHAVRVHGVY